MTTDFRALCVELVDLCRNSELQTSADLWDQVELLAERASVALAEPEILSESPTDGELTKTYWNAVHSHPERDNYLCNVAGLRAVLARWGNPAPQPANSEVAERLDRYDQALSAVMPPDFKDWWENSKEEWPDVAAGVIENLRQREELAWEQVDRLSPPQPS